MSGAEHLKLAFGDVRQKRLQTSNHFVSHMIEHIAWRMGLQIELDWPGQDWQALGKRLGEEMRKFPLLHDGPAAALGMIDDGSAAVSVRLGQPIVSFASRGGVDLDRFLALRCEQIDSGEPLVQLLDGLSSGLQAHISIDVWTLEDVHHTWEGIFRGVGVALSRLFTPPADKDFAAVPAAPLDPAADAELAVIAASETAATVARGTAETGVRVSVDLAGAGENSMEIDVDQSISGAVAGISEPFALLSQTMGASFNVKFAAKELSSSHVVMEDIGLVLGRALLEVFKRRMSSLGINGAGSNLRTPADAAEKPAQVGISVEGRKFWGIVSPHGDQQRLLDEMILGHDVLGGLRTEDLDDFLDGLSGGMSASLAVHLNEAATPEEFWRELFVGLGEALREAAAANPYRKGVPPGVKATLA